MKRLIPVVLLLAACTSQPAAKRQAAAGRFALTAAGPCDGRITSKQNLPKGAMGLIPKPAPGASYIDPIFGTTVTRITNADGDSDTANSVVSTLYNGLRGWNADGSMIIAWHRAGARTYDFYQGDAPYAQLGQLVTGTAATLNTGPADIEHIQWDSDDPTVLYYPAYDSLSSRKHPMLMKVQLHPTLDASGKVVAWALAPTVTLQRDFLAECQPKNVTSINILSIGHSSDMSYDGSRTVGLRCGGGSASGIAWNFVYSIRDNKIIGPGYMAQSFGIYTQGQDFPPWVSPTARYSWRQSPGQVYDATFNQIGTTPMVKTLEHTTVGYTTVGAGMEFVAEAGFDEAKPGSLIIWPMGAGASVPQTIIGPSTGWPYPPSGSHPSLSAKDGSGWIAVGSIGDGTGATALNNEIYLANVNTGQVCRIAHARSCDGNCGANNWTYWAETHPQISSDGYRILFNSDWEGSSSVDMYVADLRIPNPIPTPSPTPTPIPTPTPSPTPTPTPTPSPSSTVFCWPVTASGAAKTACVTLQ